MTQEDLISFTALPNGIDTGGQLRISVVLTPSIRTPTPPSPPLPGNLNQSAFYHWPQLLNATPFTWSVTFTPVDKDGNVQGPPIPATTTAVLSDSNLRLDLWKAIFGEGRPAKRRPITDPAIPPWNISPQLKQLHDRHNNLRVIHAAATIAQIASDNATSSPAKAAPADAVPVLYIFPASKDNPERCSLVAEELKFRPGALEYQGSIAAAIAAVPNTGTPVSEAFTKRVQHARMTLEPDDKTWLTPMALYAVTVTAWSRSPRKVSISLEVLIPPSPPSTSASEINGVRSPNRQSNSPESQNLPWVRGPFRRNSIPSKTTSNSFFSIAAAA